MNEVVIFSNMRNMMYKRPKTTCQGVQETQFIAACGPPGGGRMPVGTPVSRQSSQTLVLAMCIHQSVGPEKKRGKAQLHRIFVVLFLGGGQKSHVLGLQGDLIPRGYCWWSTTLRFVGH